MKLKPFILAFCLLTLALPQLVLADDLELGKASAVNVHTLQVKPEQIRFLGMVQFGDGTFAKEVNVKTTDVVDVSGLITLIKPENINDVVISAFAPAKVLVYVVSINRSRTGAFILGKTPTGKVQLSEWQGDFKTLSSRPFMELMQMPSRGMIEVPIYQGQLGAGNYQAFLGFLYPSQQARQFMYASSPRPIHIRVNNAEPSKLEGEFVAKENFLPNPDGFGFPNYGDLNLETDLTDEDVIGFLGQDQACYLSPQGKCILKALAQQWKRQQIESAGGGHCYGMAVASVRLKKGLPFKGKTQPTDFQSGATTTLDLQKSAVRHLIAYYFTAQFSGPIQTLYNDSQKPSKVLQTIIDQMNTDDPIAVIAIFKRDYSGGHAITPYAVQDKGNGEFWVYVYDNNYPDNASRVVKINRDQETWSYEAQTNPNAPIDLYEGDAGSGTLVAIPLSANENLPPFETRDVVEFQFAGQGQQMLIENWDEQRIGYDFETERHVNEIEGAEIVPVFDVGAPPRYRVPVSNTDKIAGNDFDKFLGQMFGVTVGALPGQAFERQADATLFMRASKAIAGFGNINLAPNEKFEVAIHPSAEMVYLHSATTQKPEIFLAVDDEETQQGYIYELSNLELVEGTDLMVMVDGLDLIVFSVAGLDEDAPTVTPLDSSTYSLRVTKMDASGQASARSTKLEVRAGEKTRVRVKQWGNDNTRAGNRDGDEGVIEVEVIE
ncbi:MAG: hypothetical protein DRR08_28965 [Candidatus Parabeggiatoa sp. nov. 2]|nr:MAG: hypothetical protein DRR08_28965 [Gammaproteobacteria bacterium]